MSLPCFIDIETVPETNAKNGWSELIQMYERKFRKQVSEHIQNNVSLLYTDSYNAVLDHYHNNAGLHAEFGKVICISFGAIAGSQFIIKTAVGIHEKPFLQWVAKQLGTTENLCAHNGKEFDFPFLTRRMMINGIPLPSGLNVSGKKTWDIKLEDTMDMWGGTAWKYKISLELLSYKLGVESPKTEMTGADVGDLYYSTDWDVAEQAQSAADKLGRYCGGDVLAAARCYCKMKGLADIKDGQVTHMPIQIIQNALA